MLHCGALSKTVQEYRKTCQFNFISRVSTLIWCGLTLAADKLTNTVTRATLLLHWLMLPRHVFIKHLQQPSLWRERKLELSYVFYDHCCPSPFVGRGELDTKHQTLFTLTCWYWYAVWNYLLLHPHPQKYHQIRIEKWMSTCVKVSWREFTLTVTLTALQFSTLHLFERTLICQWHLFIGSFRVAGCKKACGTFRCTQQTTGHLFCCWAPSAACSGVAEKCL